MELLTDELKFRIMDFAAVDSHPPPPCVIAMGCGKSAYAYYKNVWLLSPECVARYVRLAPFHQGRMTLAMIPVADKFIAALELLKATDEYARLYRAVAGNDFVKVVQTLRPTCALWRCPALSALFKVPGKWKCCEKMLSLGYDCYDSDPCMDAWVLRALDCVHVGFSSDELCNLMRTAGRKHDPAMLAWLMKVIGHYNHRYYGHLVMCCYAALYGDSQSSDPRPQFVWRFLEPYGYTRKVMRQRNLPLKRPEWSGDGIASAFYM